MTVDCTYPDFMLLDGEMDDPAKLEADLLQAAAQLQEQLRVLEEQEAAAAALKHQQQQGAGAGAARAGGNGGTAAAAAGKPSGRTSGPGTANPAQKAPGSGSSAAAEPSGPDGRLGAKIDSVLAALAMVNQLIDTAVDKAVEREAERKVEREAAESARRAAEKARVGGILSQAAAVSSAGVLDPAARSDRASAGGVGSKQASSAGFVAGGEEAGMPAKAKQGCACAIM